MSEQTTTSESSTEKKFRRRPVRKKAEPAQKWSTAEQKEIDSTLSNIYRDDKGRMPDMKEFAIKKSSPVATFFSFIFGIGLICAVLAWAGFFFLSDKTIGNDNQLSVAISGPTDIQLGATTTYTIKVINKQEIGLKNTSLNLYYPEGFVFLTSSQPASNAGHNEWKLENLNAGDNKEITVSGKYFGSPNEQKSWRAFFNYTPSNFNSEMQKIATLNVAIKTVPFTITLTGTDKAAVGKEATYTLTVKNEEASNYNLQLAVATPSNFVLTSSTPALGKNNRWTVSQASTTTPAGKVSTFTFRGKFKDGAGDAPLKGILYIIPPGSSQAFAVASAEMKPEVIKSNIEFATAINGSLNDLDSKPGDVLNITIRLKNTSGAEIKNAIIKLGLEAPSLKKQSILGWGQIVDKYDGDIMGEQLSDSIRRGEITWNSKKIPALAKMKANEEISLDIRLPIKDGDNFDFTSIKENTIRVNTSLEYTAGTGPTAQAAASPIVITLGSDLAFENRDNVSTNSQGKDEHAISWILTHSFHGLKNITLTADVYGDSTWLPGQVGAGTINFDPREKKITWTIPEMPESVDVLNGNFTVVLNTKNPTQNTLLSKVKIEAEDVVTGKKITLVGNEVSL